MKKLRPAVVLIVTLPAALSPWVIVTMLRGEKPTVTIADVIAGCGVLAILAAILFP